MQREKTGLQGYSRCICFSAFVGAEIYSRIEGLILP